ncbi:hypothetical protein CBOM_04401 [Ceraceosorus bombacis]|uniref:Uncharacterized protein n=1 Tax=Ceraceosorus bombacis TaxID=401625 RepID=A0A0P1BI21_9BASI|nr:hypothetical protein CBOM_04401 [Ceraceosorus bombacis]
MSVARSRPSPRDLHLTFAEASNSLESANAQVETLGSLASGTAVRDLGRDGLSVLLVSDLDFLAAVVAATVHGGGERK